jgi:hypothetical protein
MDTVVGYIARSPEACWRVFTNAALLPAWVPGLRRARVIATDADGLPREIQFEFAASLIYSLVYSYDTVAREIRWEPRAGKRDAVRGFARFEPVESGTRLTYGLEPGDERNPTDRTRDLPGLIDAFARWMLDERG